MLDEGQFWAIFGAIFICVWALIIFTIQHFRAKLREQERSRIHKEHMLALEKGILPSELTDPTNAEPQGGAWLPDLALALGCMLLFLGLGVSISFSLMSSFAELKSLGLIPGLAGSGLLFYLFLRRRLDLSGEA